MRKLLLIALLALTLGFMWGGAGAVEQATRAVTTTGVVYLRYLTVGTGTATVTPLGLLTTSVTATCTTAVTTEETLWQYTLPANSLATNGRGVRITIFGSFGATANGKTVRMYFGGSQLYAAASTAINNGPWSYRGEVMRTGATTQVGNGLLHGGQATQFIQTTNAPAETLTSAVIIKVTGQNGTAAANDICVKSAAVEAL